MNKSILVQKIKSYLLTAKQWYLETPERALDEAYKAALLIKAMEDKHFNGLKIAALSTSYRDSVMAYFQSELKNYLKTTRMRLAEFKASRSVVSSSAIQLRNNPDLILEKLRFIDSVLAKYRYYEEPSFSLSTTAQILQTKPNSPSVTQPRTPINKLETKEVTKAEETSVVPRSILSTLNRIKSECDPKSEQELLKNFRISRKKTLIAVRLIMLMIIVPFFTYYLSKQLIVGPIVDKFIISNETTVFLNYEMEERALVEMQREEEKIKFENLMGSAAEISPESMSNQMREKVREIASKFRGESDNAIKNIFADLLSVGAFSWLILVSKREIAVLKDFIDQIVYGLSDSAKAFIIILFTDMFVGFHSPHGWEVLLSGVSRHFGLPESHDFIFLFIATVPVILDTIFKYWIFRYLNRISPSAVATYRNMNE